MCRGVFINGLEQLAGCVAGKHYGQTENRGVADSEKGKIERYSNRNRNLGRFWQTSEWYR